jgi:tetratricopeptide (TPR) repeat protein
MKSAITASLVIFIFVLKISAQASITILTEGKARIWVNDVFWGITDDEGKITLRNLPVGIKRLRVRATGFKEINTLIRPTSGKELKISLTKTDDKAELAFQQAEDLVSSDKKKAMELYQQAISLNPKRAEFYVGLARVLLDQGEYEEALEAISKARKIRPIYPEASAVEGRIYRADNNQEKAIESFQRAIREGGGFQPEAHTGLGLLYQERAEESASEGDFQQERKNYDLAAYHLKKAIEQLAGAPDAIVIYQLLGIIYERQEKYTEAVKLYEEFLRKFPDSNEREMFESFITQIKKRM